MIAGAGSTLAEHGAALDEATRRNLAGHSIETKAREMSDLVSNVLDLMRFESGAPTLRSGMGVARRSGGGRAGANRGAAAETIRSN